MGGRLELSGLNAVTALLCFALPEREPHKDLYTQSLTVLDLIGESEAGLWPYLHWELALLDDLGYGLDLTECAVTGTTENLVYVSPRTGRAVSEQGAGEWRDKLFPLPDCLKSPVLADADALIDGLRTTGFFVTHHLARALGEKPVPPARQRFIDLLSRIPER